MVNWDTFSELSHVWANHPFVPCLPPLQMSALSSRLCLTLFSPPYALTLPLLFLLLTPKIPFWSCPQLLTLFPLSIYISFHTSLKMKQINKLVAVKYNEPCLVNNLPCLPTQCSEGLDNYITPEQWRSARNRCLTQVRFDLPISGPGLSH